MQAQIHKATINTNCPFSPKQKSLSNRLLFHWEFSTHRPPGNSCSRSIALRATLNIIAARLHGCCQCNALGAAVFADSRVIPPTRHVAATWPDDDRSLHVRLGGNVHSMNVHGPVKYNQPYVTNTIVTNMWWVHASTRPRPWFRYSSFLFIDISKIFLKAPTFSYIPKTQRIAANSMIVQWWQPLPMRTITHKLMGAEGHLDNCFLPILQIIWESIAPPCPLWSEGQLDLLPQAHACTCIPGHIYCTHILVCVWFDFLLTCFCLWTLHDLPFFLSQFREYKIVWLER